MSSEWQSVAIEDIAAPHSNALSTGPFGSAISSKFFTDCGVPVIRGSNLSANVSLRLIDDGIVFVTADKATEFRRSVAKRGDLVFTCWGTINQVGLIDHRAEYDEYIVSNKQMKLTVDPAKADSLFLYYVFSGPEKQKEILDNGIGSSVPGFNLGQLKRHQALLPPLNEQKRISAFLGMLDDRIALLRETNTTLEAIAQALFKSWFVDFDPVHAKQQGRAPEGLDEATAALFPDSFEESELGLVPRGWLVRGIDQTCELGRGSSPRPIQKFMGGDVPWIKIADATASEGMFVFKTKEMIIKDGVKNSVKVQPGDLIMSNSASCGITVFVELHGCIHDGWLYFKNYQHISKNFLFFWLRKIADHLVHIADGSVQKNLNISLVSSQKIICPSSDVLQGFEIIAGPLLDRVRENCIQAQTLATLRDTLLPRLISGQLRLPEAEDMIEEII